MFVHSYGVVQSRNDLQIWNRRGELIQMHAKIYSVSGQGENWPVRGSVTVETINSIQIRTEH